jgi:hypothetical protein
MCSLWLQGGLFFNRPTGVTVDIRCWTGLMDIPPHELHNGRLRINGVSWICELMVEIVLKTRICPTGQIN